MTPEKLMSLAAAKGIDLAHVAGGIPEWTAQDAAHACSGLDDQRCYAAFAYRYAGDDSQYGHLSAALTVEMSALAVAEHWPDRIEGKKYQDALVRLLLFEEWCNGRAPKYYQQIRLARLWPTLLEVSESAWDKLCERKYEAIRTKFEIWCGTARSHVNRRINEQEADDAA